MLSRGKKGSTCKTPGSETVGQKVSFREKLIKKTRKYKIFKN